MFRRMLALIISLSMLLQQAGFAQIGGQPIVSAYMQSLLPMDAFRPVQMRSLSFDAVSGSATLFVDKGSVEDAAGERLEQSVDRLMDFFYIGLALPNSSFWVNLRPDAQDQIVDPLLEKTDLGKVLLEADLQLKKDLAALTSPKTPEGKAYWDKLYSKAESLFGQENAEIPTHTRPWIVPGEIIIKETPNGAYVYKAGLKVMLEQDYAASVKTGQVQLAQAPAFADQRLQQLNDYSTQLIRSTILPKLTRQVNASKKYAQLRQAYYSLVLAQWFKSKRIGSASLLKRIDSKDLSGLTSQSPWSKQTYFNDYKKSFENGEYAMEDTVATPSGLTVRKYFSGGLNFQAPSGWMSFKGQDTAIDRSLVQVRLPGSNNDGGKVAYTIKELRDSSKAADIASKAFNASRSMTTNVIVTDEKGIDAKITLLDFAPYDGFKKIIREFSSLTFYPRDIDGRQYTHVYWGTESARAKANFRGAGLRIIALRFESKETSKGTKELGKKWDRQGLRILGPFTADTDRDSLSPQDRRDYDMLLDRDGGNVDSRAKSAALWKELESGNPNDDEIENLSEQILPLYREEVAIMGIAQMQFPEEEKKAAFAAGLPNGKNDKYTQQGLPVKYEGVTVISHHPQKHYELFRKIVGAINDFNERMGKQFIQTLPPGTEHITVYDLVSQGDTLGEEGKYETQLNQETKRAVDVRKAEIEKHNPQLDNEEAFNQAMYEVIAEKVYKVMRDFSTTLGVPVFKPAKIRTFTTWGPGPVVLGMEPATPKDLAIVTKLQDAIRKETGIKNHNTFNAHVSLGYLVQGIHQDKATFDEVKKFLEEDLQKLIDSDQTSFKMETVELNYFHSMEYFPAIYAMKWDGSAVESKRIDPVEELHTLQKNAADHPWLVGADIANIAVVSPEDAVPLRAADVFSKQDLEKIAAWVDRDRVRPEKIILQPAGWSLERDPNNLYTGMVFVKMAYDMANGQKGTRLLGSVFFDMNASDGHNASLPKADNTADIARTLYYDRMKEGASIVRDGGELVADDIGFTMRQGEDRYAQRIAVAEEIRKELEKAGSSSLPTVAFVSDYHGDAKRFAQLLSDALNRIAGFKGELNPRDSIEAQLNKQGLSLRTLKSPIYLGGDLFDRGTEGIECFLMVKEMVTIAPERVFYISGNHDFWAFGNLLGLHLPWYEGFHFYDESTPKQFIDALKGAEEMIKGKQASNPELFGTQDAFLWWTERLAEYNADQDAFQAEFFDGKIKDVREQFVKFYADNNAKWNDQQIKAMEDFAGHFARIKVPGPYVGLNGVGKTSTIWWQDLHTRLLEAYNARKAAGADEIELAMWDRAMIVCEAAVTEVHERLTKAMNEGQWWYFIFEAINTQAYASVEWWCKDWSSHKGWGEAVLAEINKLIDEGVLEGPKIDQSNYILSPVLQAYAKFCRSNFNLYLKDPYGNLYSHGWFPVQQDASISVDYKGTKYQGADIFTGLDAITADVKDLSKSLSQLREGLNVVNTWYADETTIIKPENIRENREQIGVAKINKGIGVLNWVTGHNTLDKLDTQFLHQDGAYAHIEADNGMAPKFGGKGGYVLLGPKGIKMRGYEDKDSPEIVTAPASGANVHVGMSAQEYLGNVLTHLWLEGKDGGRITVDVNMLAYFAQEETALKTLIGTEWGIKAPEYYEPVTKALPGLVAKLAAYMRKKGYRDTIVHVDLPKSVIEYDLTGDEVAVLVLMNKVLKAHSLDRKDGGKAIESALRAADSLRSLEAEEDVIARLDEVSAIFEKNNYFPGEDAFKQDVLWDIMAEAKGFSQSKKYIKIYELYAAIAVTLDTEAAKEKALYELYKDFAKGFTITAAEERGERIAVFKAYGKVARSFKEDANKILALQVLAIPREDKELAATAAAEYKQLFASLKDPEAAQRELESAGKDGGVTFEEQYVEKFLKKLTGRLMTEKETQSLLAVVVFVTGENERMQRAFVSALERLSSPNSGTDPELLSNLKTLFEALNAVPQYSMLGGFFTEALNTIGSAPENYQVKDGGKIIEQLITLMADHADKDVRIQAAIALGESGSKKAVDPLIKALLGARLLARNDASWRDLLVAVIAALGQIGDNSAAGSLIEVLQASKDGDGAIRAAAAQAVGTTAEPLDSKAISALINVLNDPAAVGQAALALGKIGDQSAVEPLKAELAKLANSWTSDKARILFALERLYSRGFKDLETERKQEEKEYDLKRKWEKEILEPNMRALQKERDYWSAEARGFGDSDPTRDGGKAVYRLIDSLSAEDKDARMQACIVLGELGDKRAVDPLIKALLGARLLARNDASWNDLLAAIITALGKIGDNSSVSYLVEVLKASKDGDGDVRAAAAKALGATAVPLDSRAIAVLIKALEDPAAVGAAAIALGKIGDESAVEPLKTQLANLENSWTSDKAQLLCALERLKSRGVKDLEAERKQAQREQAQREQAQREQARKRQAEREQAERKQAQREQAQRKQAEREYELKRKWEREVLNPQVRALREERDRWSAEARGFGDSDPTRDGGSDIDHTAAFSAIAKRIEEVITGKNDRPFVVAIMGPKGSINLEMAKQLAAVLESKQITADYIDAEAYPHPVSAFGLTPQAAEKYDWNRLQRDIDDLKRGLPIKSINKDNKVIFVVGTYFLSLLKDFDYRVSILAEGNQYWLEKQLKGAKDTEPEKVVNDFVQERLEYAGLGNVFAQSDLLYAEDTGLLRATKDGGKAELSTAKPGFAVDKLGGVDFRALPADPVNAAMGMPAVDLAAIKALAGSSKMTDLDKEWAEIEKLLKAKSMPCEKVKEFVAVCSVRQGTADKLARAQEVILETIKMEEACAIETPAQERELLVMLESI